MVVDLSSDHSRRIARVALACNNTFQQLACIAEDTSEEDNDEAIKHAETTASAIVESAPGGVDGSDVAVGDVESCGWSRPEEEDDSGPSLEKRGAVIRAPSALVSEGGAEGSAMSASFALASQAQSVSSLTGTYRGQDVVLPRAGVLALALARRQPSEQTRAAE